MHNPTNRVDMERPIVRPRCPSRIWLPLLAILVAAYVGSYGWIRQPGSRNPLPMRFGSLDRELLQVVFAPAVWCDIALRDQLAGTAQDAVRTATTRAAQEDKRGMLIFTSDHCPGCVRLDRFLQANEDTITKYFAIAQIHSSMSGFEDVTRRYRDVTDTHPEYVPYIVVVDAAGNELANSGTKLSEPIAIPSGAAENHAAFMELLCQTALPRMTAEDEAKLREAIAD
ncbi:thioredoxin domain-containing protein [Roseimaritima sediminicola]|uniref:thioredoxin family protein n=1 Tax=Roseimaritima sediminicola TaxID=2662066 RepID=UPI0012982A03|nr:thioredoxin family protein [Roseimaritima sediminicola]